MITASATDSTGRTGSATVTVKIVDTPPTVKVVSPPAGLKVLEGDDVALVGSSQDPDTWQPAPDNATRWEILRFPGPLVVHTATGHTATLPGSKVTPGSYTARFTVAGATAEAAFSVTPVPLNQTRPVAVIDEPSTTLTVGNGQPVTFSGTGSDPEDGALDGYRYRWVASSGNQVKVLCEGSAVPQNQPPGGFIAPKSCKTFTALLGIAPNDVGSTKWSVSLTVFDSTGLWDTAAVVVVVQFMVP